MGKQVVVLCSCGNEVCRFPRVPAHLVGRVLALVPLVMHCHQGGHDGSTRGVVLDEPDVVNADADFGVALEGSAEVSDIVDRCAVLIGAKADELVRRLLSDVEEIAKSLVQEALEQIHSASPSEHGETPAPAASLSHPAGGAPPLGGERGRETDSGEPGS